MSDGKLRSPVELSGKRIWVAGHRGMVGGALLRALDAERCELLTAGRETLDLRSQAAVEDWMGAERPDIVFLAAATVGGIVANDSRPAEFIYDNLAIAANVIECARRAGVDKLIYLSSSCVYPRDAAQPMTEDALLSGPLEATNQWYAVAKIAGVKLCQAYRLQYGCDFIAALPTNLYGPGDNFDLTGGHVVPALMRKIHEAHEAGRGTVEIWGSGAPRREFMHVDDCARALVHLARHYSGVDPLNVGSGEEITIRDLADTIAAVVGWSGQFVYDRTKPDGAPRKLLDSSRLTALGWRPAVPLKEGLMQTYEWYRGNAEIRA